METPSVDAKGVEGVANGDGVPLPPFKPTAWEVWGSVVRFRSEVWAKHRSKLSFKNMNARKVI